MDGDGCSSACRRESLYPGFIQVVNGRILYREEPMAIIAAAFLPQGASEQEALQAGFNVLLNSSLGLRMIWVPHGASVTDFIAPYIDDPGVLGWVGPDEPLWNGMTVDALRQNFVDPVRAADSWGRPILVNHAPRGSADDPANFDLLLPYLALSDIATMDIYPIPEGNGHSILPQHPGLSAVGEHTRILSDLAARAGGHNAVLMILSGAGLGHIPNERWEMPEHWFTDDNAAFDSLLFAQAADIDADGSAELVAGYVDGNGGHLAAYDFQAKPFGGRVHEIAVPAQLSLQHVWRTTAGDFDGDGRQDLLLVVDLSEQEQQLWVVPMQAGGFGTPFLAYTNHQPEVVWSVARLWLTGDFDQDHCDDILFSYDYPDPSHQVWFLLPSHCSGFTGNNAQLGGIRAFDAPKSVLDLARVQAAALVKPAGGAPSALLLAGSGVDGKLEILRMQVQSETLGNPQTVLHDPAGSLNPANLRQFSAGTFRGRPDSQFVLTLQEGSALRLLAGDASSSLTSESLLESWLASSGEAASLNRVSGGCAGDFDGDTVPDIALPVRGAQNRLQLDMAFSTGRFFGARDPLPAEQRFMAFDAFIHGAQGVIFWGQEFVDASHVAWSRLRDTVSELSRLRAILQGEPVFRHSAGGFSEWWVRTSDAMTLFVAQETRSGGKIFQSAYDPGTAAGSSVSRWNGEAFVLDASLSSALPFSDSQPFDAYEIRIYQFQ